MCSRETNNMCFSISEMMKCDCPMGCSYNTQTTHVGSVSHPAGRRSAPHCSSVHQPCLKGHMSSSNALDIWDITVLSLPAESNHHDLPLQNPKYKAA